MAVTEGALTQDPGMDDVRRAAAQLAEANAEDEPGMEAIYLFPAADEIRLVELDRGMMRSKAIVPYYFRADPEGGVPFQSGIALIHPDDRSLPPPDGWGTWDDAQKIWPLGDGGG
jgi:hypothetical protein